MRFKCHLLACNTGSHDPCCHRCGTGLYDGDFVQRGAIAPVIEFWWKFRHFLRRWWPWKRCQECGVRMTWGWDDRHYFCSKECADAWIPF